MFTREISNTLGTADLECSYCRSDSILVWCNSCWFCRLGHFVVRPHVTKCNFVSFSCCITNAIELNCTLKDIQISSNRNLFHLMCPFGTDITGTHLAASASRLSISEQYLRTVSRSACNSLCQSYWTCPMNLQSGWYIIVCSQIL